MRESLILAEHIARINYDDIPDNAVEVTKKSLLDGLGVMLAAGTLGEGCQQFIRLAIESGGKTESKVIGFDARLPASMAAFANGSMSHALDFEDTHDKAFVHPNAAVIPAALAIAESTGNVSGKEFITALALGSDIVCRLGLAINEDPIQYGWYMPPILSAFGATAAACKLLKLNPKQILDAFSLTLCQATCSAELTNNPHTIIRAIRDAFPAKAGVLSALLAKRNIAGYEQPLEGKSGLLELYARRQYNLSALTRGLGKTFEGANVSFKPWPSCRGTHSYIESALQLMKDHDFKPGDIKGIRLVTAPTPVNRVLCEPLHRKQNPKVAIDAKFSIPYVIAIAVVHGGVTLDHFTPGGLKNPEVLRIANKISYETDGTIKNNRGFLFIDNGQKIVSLKAPRFVYGHPRNPLSQQSLVEKFLDCASHSAKRISKNNLNAVAQLVLGLENIDDIGEFVKYL